MNYKRNFVRFPIHLRITRPINTILLAILLVLCGCQKKPIGNTNNNIVPPAAQLALLPDEKTQRYALTNLNTGNSLMQTDISITKQPIFTINNDHLAVVVDNELHLWDLQRKSKVEKQLSLNEGSKTDILITDKTILVSGQTNNTLEAFSWPDLEKQTIEGWQSRKSIEALDEKDGLIFALDNILVDKYLIIFEPTQTGLQLHSTLSLPAGVNSHYSAAEMNSKYWVIHMNYAHKGGSGDVLYFIDSTTLTPDQEGKTDNQCEEEVPKSADKSSQEENNTDDSMDETNVDAQENKILFEAEDTRCLIFETGVISVGDLHWSNSMNNPTNPINIRDYKFLSDGRLLLLSNLGVGVVDPNEVIKINRPEGQLESQIHWEPVSNAVTIYPMTDGKAAVIVVDDPTYPEGFPFPEQIKIHEGGKFKWKTVTYQ
jgi:hypothetical protein